MLKAAIYLVVLLNCPCNPEAGKILTGSEIMDIIASAKKYLQRVVKKDYSGTLVIIDTKKQVLLLLKNWSIVKKYTVSTSAFGKGSEKNSYKTPPGLHRIYKKIGEGKPVGARFKGRKFTGEIIDTSKLTESQKQEDMVLTRILWLEGVEEGINKGGTKDSKSRYIYIHGTHREDLIGKPASKGCIRMMNQDILQLFDEVQEKDFVLIF